MVAGRCRSKCQPSSRIGENPPYGMIGRVEETSASFEARSAPRLYPTAGGAMKIASLPLLRRRTLIALLGGATVAWPFAARAQQDGRMRHVGVLVGLRENDPQAKARFAGFRQGFEKFGWFEGRNVLFEHRYAPAGARAQEIARELIALQPEVILAQGTPISVALKQETQTVPVVFVGNVDPVGSGFVASLARPGGNLTGFLSLEASITGKWMAMLKEGGERTLTSAPGEAAARNLPLPSSRQQMNPWPPLSQRRASQ